MNTPAVILSSALLLATSALAEDWPRRAVTFVIPSAPGSSSDVVARALAERLSARWKQPVVIDNKSGAGATIATNAVAKARDGHTMGWVIASHATNPTLRANLPYDTVKDLSGVALVYQLRPVIVASPGYEASTIDELVALARRRPGQFYASAGIGTGPHLLGELFKQKYRLDLQHVPHKSGAAAQLDVFSGRIPIMFDTLPNALPLARQGRMKILAVIGDEPVPGHPDLPLLRDLLPSDAIVGWNGIVVPSATPREVVRKLNADIAEAMRSDSVQALFASLGVRPLGATPEEFDAFIREDIARWAEVIRRAGIKLD
ncbi:MAG TPA: tripartite tricarboxylate transporter substrate-binding protein [Usitatibacter sp.]|nr:tripartite tricarboxylate transporter substrate-binding protein [Usitatibacter sp.]